MECKCVMVALVVAGATSAAAGNKKGKRKDERETATGSSRSNTGVSNVLGKPDRTVPLSSHDTQQEQGMLYPSVVNVPYNVRLALVTVCVCVCVHDTRTRSWTVSSFSRCFAASSFVARRFAAHEFLLQSGRGR